MSPLVTPLLEVRDVTAFYGDFQALWGLSLDVFEGEIVVLLGGNGAGKTTLLRVLSGILKARSGTVRMRGREITNLEPDVLVQMGIAHAPEGRQLFHEMTVEENLYAGSYVARSRVNRAASIERIHAIFPRLRERRKQLAGTLSGGEQQMLAIGRALMSEPTILLLDEPSVGLSPAITEQMLATIADIARDHLTVVLVEQKVVEGLAIARRGYVIEQGRMVTSGPAQALKDDAVLAAAYLGL